MDDNALRTISGTTVLILGLIGSLLFVHFGLWNILSKQQPKEKTTSVVISRQIRGLGLLLLGAVLLQTAVGISLYLNPKLLKFIEKRNEAKDARFP